MQQEQEENVKYKKITQGDLVKRVNTKSLYLMDMIEEEINQINNIDDKEIQQENSKKGS